ncbi:MULTISPECIES: amino acid ABC transporter permease [Marinobacter]|uniref:Amino acid ABC transporter permease n=1 Tax=Marinobacter suaedae TaxID=3057675 RepID=A0ABT8VVV3_9GAMM|nr:MULTISPECIES: amino acid ABC transporter permease [unclassified Marinobacter]MBZ2168248.1 amino acid ABC transporter permease [Marinobacter sp. F4216]MDO3720121.1 amino acid ABC transporter permease [Marinobacter sp. chi1]
MEFDFSAVITYFPTLLKGVGVAALVALAVALMSVLGGLVVAVISIYTNKVVSAPLRFFIWLFMTTPLLLQLYFLYFGLGEWILIPAVVVGILGLGFHYMAYNADIFITTIKSVSGGQYEASRSLGFGHWRTILYIIVPQAFIRSIPQLGNNMILMVKDTSVLSAIGVAELVYASQYAISVSFRPFEFFIVIAAMYYVINIVMELGQAWLERQTSYRH